jgi:hypothetical protein
MQETKVAEGQNPTDPVYYASVECNSMYSSADGNVTEDFLADVNGFYCPKGKPNMEIQGTDPDSAPGNFEFKRWHFMVVPCDLAN